MHGGLKGKNRSCSFAAHSKGRVQYRQKLVHFSNRCSSLPMGDHTECLSLPCHAQMAGSSVNNLGISVKNRVRHEAGKEGRQKNDGRGHEGGDLAKKKKKGCRPSALMAEGRGAMLFTGTGRGKILMMECFLCGKNILLASISTILLDAL